SSLGRRSAMLLGPLGCSVLPSVITKQPQRPSSTPGRYGDPGPPPQRQDVGTRSVGQQVRVGFASCSSLTSQPPRSAEYKRSLNITIVRGLAGGSNTDWPLESTTSTLELSLQASITAS